MTQCLPGLEPKAGQIHRLGEVRPAKQLEIEDPKEKRAGLAEWQWALPEWQSE